MSQLDVDESSAHGLNHEPAHRLANDDAVGRHAGRAATALAELADPGQALITGGVIVEMGDDGFERFATGSMGGAELDGTSYAVYAIRRRQGGAP